MINIIDTKLPQDMESALVLFVDLFYQIYDHVLRKNAHNQLLQLLKFTIYQKKIMKHRIK